MTGDRSAAIDALLTAGDNAEAARTAEQALAGAPADEQLLARLMLALARSGRPGDALRAFQQGRRTLPDRPSEWLVVLERAIALRDPAVADVGATAEFIPPASSSRSRLRSDHTLPQGVITFLMTDVVGSTRLWETVPRAMRHALARHDEIVSDVVESHDGSVVRERGEGDSTFSVFARATDAAAAALTLETCLAEEPWSPECRIEIRAALHTGEASVRDGDYYGRVVNRTARLRDLAQPGQVLASESTAQLVLDHLPSDSLLVSLGVQSLKDMDRPERVFLLLAAEPEVAPDGPVDHVPSGSASHWVLVVGADRSYHDTIAMDPDDAPDWGLRHEITLTRPSTSIGRAHPSVGLTPDIDITALTGDAAVSRSHAVVEWADDGSLAVVDLGSTNGTYVGSLDEPVAPNEPHVLSDGDRVYLGAWTVLEARTIGPAEAG